jgi:hypothetical protein
VTAGYHVEPAAILYAMRVYCSTTKSLEIHMPGSVDQPMPQHNTTSTTWRSNTESRAHKPNMVISPHSQCDSTSAAIQASQYEYEDV